MPTRQLANSPTSPHRWPRGAPRARPLYLRRERQQRALVVGAAHQLDAERHAVAVEACWYRRRRLARVVPYGRVADEGGAAVEGAQRSGVPPAADRVRRGGHGRRDQDVHALERLVDAGGQRRLEPEPASQCPLVGQLAQAGPPAGAPPPPAPGLRARGGARPPPPGTRADPPPPPAAAGARPHHPPGP